MSLRVDLEEALEALRKTWKQLDNACKCLQNDIVALEEKVDRQCDLKSKPVPAKVFQGLEKAINGQ